MQVRNAIARFIQSLWLHDGVTKNGGVRLGMPLWYELLGNRCYGSVSIALLEKDQYLPPLFREPLLTLGARRLEFAATMELKNW